MNLVWYASDSIACGVVRADVLCRGINQLGGHFAITKTMPGLGEMFATDVIVFQRPHTAEAFDRIGTFKKRGIKVVVDIDDDLLSVPKEVGTAHDFYSKPEARKAVEDSLRAADLITTSTPTLQGVLKSRYGLPSVVMPNCIDVHHARTARESSLKSDKLTIMWHGSESHLGDVGVVAGALKRLSANYSFSLKLFGHFTPEHFKGYLDAVDVQYSGWTSPNQLYFFLATADIGMCPIKDSQFNRCKSEIKWLEYGSVGVPCVLSPLDPYSMVKDGVNGVVASGNTEDGWFEALSILAQSSDFRRAVGSSANVSVYDRYDHRDRAREWVDLLTNTFNMG